MSSIPRHWVLQKAIHKKASRPCQNCQDRAINCHSKCAKYAEYKTEIHNETKAAYERFLCDRLIDDSEIRAKQRQIRSGNKHDAEKWNAYRIGGVE